MQPLVYMMKRFVKTACIGDASRGSLSSYAYTLMVLYFLQQIEPPILPVLQEVSSRALHPSFTSFSFLLVFSFRSFL